jgi:EAL domain-containing protein (putative c-di-GMP-specific phosphodiesterase class I)
MGVRIAIDDFGTGYSNFAYLRRLPVHALKLAGPFMTGAAGGTETGEHVDREVVGLVIAMAHTLGLTVTAESVETAVQFAHLQQLGCDLGQGWFFAAAVPAEEIPPLLGRRLGEQP